MQIKLADIMQPVFNLLKKIRFSAQSAKSAATAPCTQLQREAPANNARVSGIVHWDNEANQCQAPEPADMKP